MREIILCKYGEITLKGANRAYFENLLRERIRKRIAAYGKFNVYYLQSTVYIEPLDESCDIDSAYVAAKNTFGVAAVARHRGGKECWQDSGNGKNRVYSLS